MLLQDLTVMRGFEPVTWPGGAGECPTQIAFVTDEEGNLQALWGSEVDKALSAGRITEKEILRWLKATVFDSGNGAAEGFHHQRLAHRIAQLRNSSSDLDVQRATPFSIWTLYLNLSFNFVLRKIKEKVGSDLPWPAPGSLKEAYTVDFQAGDNQAVKVEVALPVPAELGAKLCQRALAAAKKAGLPNCYLVAEPASVAAFVAQEDFETHPSAPDTRPTLFVDNGSGTIDLTLTSLSVTTQGGGLSLRERVAGKMAWSGAGFVNEAFRRVIREEINTIFVTNHINSTPGLQVKQTAETWVEALEREFELAKKSFDGSDDLHLRAPYTPRRNFGRLRLTGETLVIPAEVVVGLFEDCLHSAFDLIDQQIQTYNVLCKKEARALDIRRLCLAGGGNENEYVRKRIIEEYSDRFEVMRPSSSTKAKMMTVTGALLLLLDKPFVGERVARRGYCFVRDEPKLRHRYGAGRVFYDPMENREMIKDAAIFVLRVGEAVKNGFERRIRGRRGLYLDEDTGDGWPIEEGLWYTDNAAGCKDGVWIFTDKNGGFGEAGTIEFQLTTENALGFHSEPDHYGRYYYDVQYEVVFTVVGLDVCFEIVIPRSGKFVEGVTDHDAFIKERVHLQDSFMYELYASTGVKREVIEA